MNGLRSIRQNNIAAVQAYHADHGQVHLLSAPVAERFDHNVPWSYADGVATLNLHVKTKVADVIKVKRLAAVEFGRDIRYEEKRYN